jgi:hypothetical protein
MILLGLELERQRTEECVFELPLMRLVSVGKNSIAVVGTPSVQAHDVLAGRPARLRCAWRGLAAPC